MEIVQKEEEDKEMPNNPPGTNEIQHPFQEHQAKIEIEGLEI